MHEALENLHVELDGVFSGQTNPWVMVSKSSDYVKLRIQFATSSCNILQIVTFLQYIANHVKSIRSVIEISTYLSSFSFSRTCLRCSDFSLSD